MTGACASNADERPVFDLADRHFENIVIELLVTRYDGHRLEGRVLIRGDNATPLVINDSLMEFEDVSFEQARACGTTNLLPFRAWDPPRRRTTDVPHTLYTGQWHGSEVKFPLSDQTSPWPDCFEANLVVRVIDGRVAAKLPVRVERTDKPKDTSDTGAPVEPNPPAPAGAAP